MATGIRFIVRNQQQALHFDALLYLMDENSFGMTVINKPS